MGQKEGRDSVSAVKEVDDGVRLTLTKGEVGDLPPVDPDDPQ